MNVINKQGFDFNSFELSYKTEQVKSKAQDTTESGEIFQKINTISKTLIVTPTPSVNPYEKFEISREELAADMRRFSTKEDEENLVKVDKTKRNFRKKSIEKQEENDEEKTVIIKPERKKIKVLNKQNDVSKLDEKEENKENITLPINISSKISKPLKSSFKGDEICQIWFSQKSISEALSDSTFLFKDHYRNSCLASPVTLYDVLRTKGWKNGSHIDIVKMPNDVYTSLDNRRLAVAQAVVRFASSSLEIKAHPHQHLDTAANNIWRRILVNGESFSSSKRPDIFNASWGHVIVTRVAKSSGYKEPTEDTPYGFSDLPVVLVGLKGHNKKSIEQMIPQY